MPGTRQPLDKLLLFGATGDLSQRMFIGIGTFLGFLGFMGRELFGLFRGAADEAELGASAIFAGAGL